MSTKPHCCRALIVITRGAASPTGAGALSTSPAKAYARPFTMNDARVDGAVDGAVVAVVECDGDDGERLSLSWRCWEEGGTEEDEEDEEEGEEDAAAATTATGIAAVLAAAAAAAAANSTAGTDAARRGATVAAAYRAGSSRGSESATELESSRRSRRARMEDCVLPSFVMAKRMSRSSFGEDEPCDTLELSMVSMMSAVPSPRKSKACQVEEREPPRAMMVWRHWQYCCSAGARHGTGARARAGQAATQQQRDEPV